MQVDCKKFLAPEGFKDFLPDEAFQKRILENKWIKLFQSWAYKEIISASFEFYDTLMMNVGVNTSTLLKIIDRDGHLLALRPDMTSPIARLVATRMRDYDFPHRLFYIANVFRYEDEVQRGRHREFYQAGVELIGPKGPKADGEVIALAVEALKTAGLREFQIGLGHIEVTKELLKQLSAGENKEKEARDALARKNFVKLESLFDIKAQTLEEKVFKILTSLDSLDNMIIRLNQVAKTSKLLQAINELKELNTTLKAFGVDNKIFVDFSILRDFNYYTGIIFEGYSDSLGFPLCGGGRYDKLLGNFGFDCPATGFALGVERVLQVLKKEAYQTKFEIDYLVCGENEAKVIKEAIKLRNDGYNVEIEIMGLKDAELAAYAQARGIKNILEVLKQEGDI